MAPSLRVGLTGGIGSGKSTVADMLAELGAEVVDTDVIAHALTSAHGEAIAPIRAAFGDAMLDREDALDRAAMRRLVFADEQARRRLEVILHPLILRQSLQRMHASRSAYVVVVVPLLAEHLHAYRPHLDRIAVVDCEESEQLRRTALRPGMDIDQARAILAAQSKRDERLAIADDVIENLGSLSALRARVVRLHESYLRLAAQRAQKKLKMPLH
ncbi:MAG: dephospho-CoA kinase [bacterium]|nr:MAG: dephospho-CoA kinase [bacterium]KAF0150027.1 MAG: dephospho-CoA kinase [bacterium]KAF0169135.1 MAG: dephospho-CoA kinase [bacterium]TXT21458.1 MAG: dephospho-CoA kinase [bacterium]